MTLFEPDYFQKQAFTVGQIQRYMDSSRRDLLIAQNDAFTEVQFSYAYQALLKAGIALIAKKGGVKVRSVPGHHIKILTHMSRLLADEDVLTIGNHAHEAQPGFVHRRRFNFEKGSRGLCGVCRRDCEEGGGDFKGLMMTKSI